MTDNSNSQSVNRWYHFPRLCQDCKMVVVVLGSQYGGDLLCTKCYRKRLKGEGKKLPSELEDIFT